MAKKRPTFKIYSYGEYTKWNRNSRHIPKILNITTQIKAAIGTEFGYVLHIKNGKGEKLSFQIDHPPFKDNKGQVRPPFTGEQFISSNDFQFFLGDYIWKPLHDKLGKWELTVWYKDKVVAHKILLLE